MIPPIVFSIFGTPRPKSRPRFVPGRRKPVSTANPHEKLWKKEVERTAFATAIARGDPLPLFRGPVRVDMVFTFEPPKSERDRLGTPHTHKPDKDNLEKLVLDAMVKARILADDGQVAAGDVVKLWGERAGVAVRAEQVDAAPAQAPTGAAEGDRPDWLTGRTAPGPAPAARG